MTMKQRIYSYARSSYAWAKGHKPVLWAGAIVAAVIVVILLAVLLPRPGPEGPGATPTPSATPSGNATATPEGTTSPGGTPSGTATAGATKTSGGTPSGTATPRPTRTPQPTSGGGLPVAEIFFTEGGYTATQDGDGCERFLTTVNITAPVEFFGVCQFRLMWDAALFKLDHAWVNSNAGARGRLYNGSAWLGSSQPLSNPTGDNPFGQNYCPRERPDMGDGKQGCANFLADFSNLMRAGNGVNIAVPPSGPAEATLITIRWTTSGPGCWGTTANTGTTELAFIPTLMCACSAGAQEYDMEDEYRLTWFNTSVTVK